MWGEIEDVREKLSGRRMLVPCANSVSWLTLALSALTLRFSAVFSSCVLTGSFLPSAHCTITVAQSLIR